MRRNRPSRTALKVARAVVFEAGDPEVAALLPPGLAATQERLLVSSGLLSEGQRRLMARPRFRRFYQRFDARSAGGQLLFIALRKRLISDEAAAAIQGGRRQVLVLGGGLDTLALRLATRHPEVELVELDHPASQVVKRGALERLGPLPANLHLVAADFASDDIPTALAPLPTWSSQVPAFVVAEGVLMYLPLPAVERTLRQLREATGPGTALLVSYMRRDSRGRLQLGRMPRLAAWGLVLVGEPLLWGVREGELANVLAGAGWQLELERFDLRQRYLAPAGLGDRPLADIELYALARRA